MSAARLYKQTNMWTCLAVCVRFGVRLVSVWVEKGHILKWQFYHSVMRFYLHLYEMMLCKYTWTWTKVIISILLNRTCLISVFLKETKICKAFLVRTKQYCSGSRAAVYRKLSWLHIVCSLWQEYRVFFWTHHRRLSCGSNNSETLIARQVWFVLFWHLDDDCLILKTSTSPSVSM